MPEDDGELSPPMALNAVDRKLLEDAAYLAGGIGLGFWRRDPRVWLKPSNSAAAGTQPSSPVSEADLAIDQFLMDKLAQARPDYGWLSEEAVDNAARLDLKRVFVVDPIDGTRAFLNGSTEWTVSLAVVENGRPVAAALYRPATDTMYSASIGDGAFIDGAALRLPDVSPLPDNSLRVAGPIQFARQLGTKGYKVDEHHYVPSLALRIALAATARYDLVFSRTGASDWDIAAADLILAESGGQLLDQTGHPPGYNRASPRHGMLIGGRTARIRQAITDGIFALDPRPV